MPLSHQVAASLDDLDRDILEMHQKDVFFSYADLAEKWEVTVATIRNRIKRLKASGVMDVLLVVNPYKIGSNTFAIIGIKLETGASFLVSPNTTKQTSLFELLVCDFNYSSRNRSGHQLALFSR